MKTNIPKLARNKYNYVKGAASNNYITQTQYMMSNGSGGGGGGGSNTWTIQQQYKIAQMMNERGVLTYDNVKTINGYSIAGDGDIEITASGSVDLSAYMTKQEMSAYVSKVELDNASYLNQSYLDSEMSKYPTFSNIEAMGYVTNTELSNAGYLTDTYLANELKNYTRFSDIEAMGYATTSYVVSKCEEVQEASYAYTDSKTKNMMTYSEIDDLVKQIINGMIATGELVNAAYVVSKVNEGRV